MSKNPKTSRGAVAWPEAVNQHFSLDSASSGTIAARLAVRRTMELFRTRLLVILAIAIIFLFYYLRALDPAEQVASLHHAKSATNTIKPANNTLGFGAILAVSKPQSSRARDLLYSADLTGLNVTIPPQPTWTELDKSAFRSSSTSRITNGSLMAWLGHLNALRWFLDITSLETALIIEDDVDWDINIRPTQVPLASQAFNKMMNTSASSSSPHYWSDLKKWEILYLGHCGDFFLSNQLETVDHQVYRDSTTPDHENLHQYTSSFLNKLNMTEQSRMVHRSLWPLCTFGYGVTRSSAKRILSTYSTEGSKGCQAYDVRILEACRDDDWACYTINPELMHHIEAPSEIANVNSGIDDQGRLQGATPGKTANIGCGARNDGFKSEDQEVIEWLRKEVGEKQHCLLDEPGMDMGRVP